MSYAGLGNDRHPIILVSLASIYVAPHHGESRFSLELSNAFKEE